MRKIVLELAVGVAVMALLGGCHHEKRAPKPRPTPSVASTTTTSETLAQPISITPQHTG